jgi:transcriptional regulator GlxA family with amidase domain
MDTHRKTRQIDVFLFDGVNLLDVAGPVQAFEAAHPHYAPRYVSLTGQAVRASCGLRLGVDKALANSAPDRDLLIPGGTVDPLIGNTELTTAIRRRLRHTGNGRLISICSGALLLAGAGVLDGHAATTHWSRAEHVKTFERVHWDLDRIFTAEDRIFTSAGVSTGIDLALAIIRRDCGAGVALAAARELVMQLRRSGGQTQYAPHLAAQFSHDDALSGLIEQVVTAPCRNWTLDTLSETAGMNPRTLSRHFKRDLDQTPAQFVEQIRVDHARGLLLENLPLKQVARDSGFGDLQRMRRAFKRRFGVHVSDYADAFGV